MKIALLHDTLTVAETPGLDSTDPRFDEIVTATQQSEFIKAATLSEAVIAEGIYDIRLIAYFLYGHLEEGGLGKMTEVLSTLAGLLGDSWDAVGPVSRKEKNTQNSLGWLFRQILKNLEYQEAKKTANYDAWQASVSSDDVEAMLEAGGKMRRGLGERLEDAAGSILDLWSKVQEWLRNFQRLVYREPVAEVAEEAPAVGTAADASGAARGAGTTVIGQLVEGSFPLTQLLAKLDAFERLIQKGKFPRAALLADDINQELANFDPKVYFPKLLGRYYTTMAINMTELYQYVDQRDTVEWQAFKELLKVDIEAFVNVE